MKTLSIIDDEEREGSIRDYDYKILDHINEIMEDLEEEIMISGIGITMVDTFGMDESFFDAHIFPVDLKESFIRFM